MKNPRKDKRLYNLWLTKAEEISLFKSLKDLNSEKRQFAITNITDIIETANKRGDLERR